LRMYRQIHVADSHYTRHSRKSVRGQCMSYLGEKSLSNGSFTALCAKVVADLASLFICSICFDTHCGVFCPRTDFPRRFRWPRFAIARSPSLSGLVLVDGMELNAAKGRFSLQRDVFRYNDAALSGSVSNHILTTFNTCEYSRWCIFVLFITVVNWLSCVC
jgi:hypothetical protein